VTFEVPTKELLERVRAAVCYSYEAGEYPVPMASDVIDFLSPDGGVLRLLNIATDLLEEVGRLREALRAIAEMQLHEDVWMTLLVAQTRARSALM
jgi:hypothetical protein